MSSSTGELTLFDWSVVSPLGMGTEPFSEGIRTGSTAVRSLKREEWPGPFTEAGIVPSFSIAGALGKKGTRSMDRATGLAVATVGRLLATERALAEVPAERVGLVLGTSAGSVESIMEFTRDSLTREKPYHVDPARFPNTVMNCAAGQCAIWYGLKGPNTTLAGGHVTGLMALKYAARLVRCGHAATMLCGAVEEFSFQRSWLEWRAGEGRSAPPPGEGCAVFLAGPTGVPGTLRRRTLAAVLAVELAAFGRGTSAGAALGACIRRALERAGLQGGDVWAVAPSGCGALAAEEESALASVLGGDPIRVPSVEVLGDTAAASAMFQLAALVAVGGSDRQAGRVGLVTSCDRDGLVGCALVRCAPA
jgi:3-oxoacyl-[acyl-carrier-protein] synthase II